jgi:Homeodomain-like domain
MPAHQKVPLRPLFPLEEQELARIVKASSERQDRVRRAQALLAVAAGHPFTAAATAAGFKSGDSIAHLVVRFNHQGLAALDIAAGRGRRARYDSAARTRIVQKVQTPPDRTQDGTATWSLTTLQRALRTTDPGLAELGATTIRRVLAAADYSYQRTRTWCPTGTAQRKRKTGVVTVVDPEAELKKK